MSIQRDPDAILASWLEEGPSRLPDATRRAIAVTTRTTRQTRRPMRVPWRIPTMTAYARLAAVALIGVVALAGTFMLLRPGQPSVGGPVVSPSPIAETIDGVWEACPTVQDILSAGGGTAEANGNAGCTTLTLRNGAFSETGVSASTSVPGTYAVTGDRVTIHRSNGEVFDFTWVAAGDTLTLKKSRVPQALSPAPWIARPFHRKTPSQASSGQSSPSRAILGNGGDVFPGTYQTALEPRMTLTIDKEVKHNCASGFQCRGTIDINTPGGLNIEFGQPRIEILVIRVDKVVDLKNPGQLIDPPSDLPGWIATVPGITVVNPPKGVKVGGLDATQIDVRTGDKDVTFGPIPGVNDPGFGMGANSTRRFIVVKVDGRQVVISPAGEDPFLTSISETQPLVDSIVWN